jgi:hypothetical protein
MRKCGYVGIPDSGRKGNVFDTAQPSAALAAALQVTGLDPQAGIEAERVVEDRAQEYKAAGLEGGIDKLRVRALTDTITGRNALTDGDERPGFPARVHLTVPELIAPVVTLLGLADIPGELDGQVIDPALVRELVQAARARATGRTGT